MAEAMAPGRFSQIPGPDLTVYTRSPLALYNFLIYAFTHTIVEGTAIRFHVL